VPLLFARQSELAHRPAIAQHGTTWTYAELAARCGHIADQLRDRGVRAGETVVVTGARTPDLVAAMLAVWMTGAVLVPIDPALPEQRRSLMAGEAGAGWLIGVDEAGWAVRPVSRAGAAQQPGTGVPSPGMLAGAGARPADAAYIFYTSGTTGTPNAILGSHRGLSHFLQWQRATFDVGPGDRCAQLTGLSFDVVLRDIFLPLIAGATLCLPDGGRTPPPEEICRWLERDRVSIVHAVPTVADAWLPQRGSAFTGPLRAVFFAGEPLTGALAGRWRAAWPSTRHVVNLYGPTETTLAACFHVVADPAGTGIQPLGQPLPGIKALVIGEDGGICGPGEPGEICISSPFRSHGYLNNPAEGARRFVPGPAGEDSADVLFRTGDLGCWRPDSLLEYRGRLDEQVKILGVRVQPDEAAAVLESHPQVDACRVVSDRDQRGNAVLRAYYIPALAPNPVQAAELRRYLADRLPTSLIPATFTPVTRFPVTPNGKLDRAALQPAATAAGGPPAATSDPLLRLLAEIWAEVLDIPLPAAEDDFFELGGHSLLAASMLSRVRAEYGADVPLRMLLKEPTLGGFAAVVQRLSRPDTDRRPTIPRLPRPESGRSGPGSRHQGAAGHAGGLRPGHQEGQP
jgi:amino acid adenylation domain-containing protein